MLAGVAFFVVVVLSETELVVSPPAVVCGPPSGSMGALIRQRARVRVRGHVCHKGSVCCDWICEGIDRDKDEHQQDQYHRCTCV